jgi:hypothetical protein
MTEYGECFFTHEAMFRLLKHYTESRKIKPDELDSLRAVANGIMTARRMCGLLPGNFVVTSLTLETLCEKPEQEYPVP